MKRRSLLLGLEATLFGSALNPTNLSASEEKKSLFLPEGLKSFSEDAAFLESKRYVEAQILSIFCVPRHILCSRQDAHD